MGVWKLNAIGSRGRAMLLALVSFGLAAVPALADPALLADAKKLGVTIAPVPGEELAALIKRLMSLPPALLARAKAIAAP